MPNLSEIFGKHIIPGQKSLGQKGRNKMSNKIILATGTVSAWKVDMNELKNENTKIFTIDNLIAVYNCNRSADDLELDLSSFEINDEFKNSDVYRKIRDNCLLIYPKSIFFHAGAKIVVGNYEQVFELLELLAEDKSVKAQQSKAREIQCSINKQIKEKGLKPKRKKKEKVDVKTVYKNFLAAENLKNSTQGF